MTKISIIIMLISISAFSQEIGMSEENFNYSVGSELRSSYESDGYISNTYDSNGTLYTFVNGKLHSKYDYHHIYDNSPNFDYNYHDIYDNSPKSGYKHKEPSNRQKAKWNATYKKLMNIKKKRTKRTKRKDQKLTVQQMIERDKKLAEERDKKHSKKRKAIKEK